jgi:hypothetical protein
LNRRIGIPFQVLDGEVEAGAFELGPVILIPPKGFPVILFTFLGGIRVDRCLSLAGPSPWGIVTGSGGGLFRGLDTRITSQNCDGRDWDIAFKTGMGKIELSMSCIKEIKI